MPPQDNWEKYQVHVLSSLEEQGHNINEIHAKLETLSLDINTFKANYRWEMRIGVAVWSVIVFVVNFLIGKHS